ncbi:MAG: nitroreductase family protein [Clostridium perfringens]|nr:nitroreductase family protein [Clostridium perfringens]
MKINIPVKETIKNRNSVRTYEERKLSVEDKEKLIKYINSLTNPFGEKVNIHIIEKGINSKGEKLGTYGIIKGASTFLGVSVENTELGLEAVGYEFENLILYATDMGLGTVWLAVTFNRDGFASAMGIKENELFPAISPVGYPAEKKSIKESMMRKMMKSDQRKPWDTLFFNNSFSTPLTEEEAGVYKEPLEMLRLAPSATNAQPWRVVKEGDAYHFYETHKVSSSEEEKLIKRVDMGIALSHFHQTALENGLLGKFEKLSEQNIKTPKNTNYIISWVGNIN